MAKIAVESEGAGTTQPPLSRQLAAGEGWSAAEVVCTAGPADRPFEERHDRTSIAVVLSGTFQYRTAAGRQLMTPGSLLLGNSGDCFCCGHEHGTGDRCLAVSYDAEFFERLAADTGMTGPRRFFAPRIPPVRDLAGTLAKASTLLSHHGANTTCEEFAIELARQAVRLAQKLPADRTGAKPSSLARVTRVVRMIEHEPGMPHELASLARIARLSPYHFLRTFEELTGVTPHQYVVRMRLRRAATRLKVESTRVLEIAFDCGFGDVSNFNRAFRGEFGMSPTAYRR